MRSCQASVFLHWFHLQFSVLWTSTSHVDMMLQCNTFRWGWNACHTAYLIAHVLPALMFECSALIFLDETTHSEIIWTTEDLKFWSSCDSWRQPISKVTNLVNDKLLCSWANILLHKNVASRLQTTTASMEEGNGVICQELLTFRATAIPVLITSIWDTLTRIQETLTGASPSVSFTWKAD